MRHNPFQGMRQKFYLRCHCHLFNPPFPRRIASCCTVYMRLWRPASEDSRYRYGSPIIPPHHPPTPKMQTSPPQHLLPPARTPRSLPRSAFSCHLSDVQLTATIELAKKADIECRLGVSKLLKGFIYLLHLSTSKSCHGLGTSLSTQTIRPAHKAAFPRAARCRFSHNSVSSTTILRTDRTNREY